MEILKLKGIWNKKSTEWASQKNGNERFSDFEHMDTEILQSEEERTKKHGQKLKVWQRNKGNSMERGQSFQQMVLEQLDMDIHVQK